MLSIKERQTYLKHLGFYFGNIDGIVGPKTKTAYKSLQKTFFIREKDIDGIYGKNTDILLQNAYNVSVY
ncbi:MAG: peptidoglycan-binding protein, partial [Clostridia bacterium]|nr:peptidoglycan-binding protein [Clostridia bacterium]